MAMPKDIKRELYNNKDYTFTREWETGMGYRWRARNRGNSALVAEAKTLKAVEAAVANPKTVLAQAVKDWGDNRLYRDGAGNWRLKSEDYGGKRTIAPYNKELKRLGITSDRLYGLHKFPKALTNPAMRLTTLGQARVQGKAPFDAQTTVLAYLSEYGATTREDLPAATNLPVARVEHVLTLLIRRGLVSEG